MPRHVQARHEQRRGPVHFTNHGRTRDDIECALAAHLHIQTRQFPPRYIEGEQVVPLSLRAAEAERRQAGARYHEQQMVVVYPANGSQLCIADMHRAERLGFTEPLNHEIALIADRPHVGELGSVRRERQILERGKAPVRLERRRRFTGKGVKILEEQQAGPYTGDHPPP